MAEQEGGPGSDPGLALFLDFDGTLVEIAPTPDAVVVDPELPGLLTAVRRRLGGALAIVTGRPLAGVDEHLPGLGLDACGMHGLERRVGGRVSFPAGFADLAPFIASLQDRLRPFPGVIIEDKRIGVAVHWRTAPEAEFAARDAIDELAIALGPAYKIQEGKAVRELVPASAGKGKGIRALMEQEPYLGRRAVFIGDDKTDEHGFEAVNELGGVTIKVGAGGTVARHRIPSPIAVRDLLRNWSEHPIDPGALPPA